MNHNTNGSDPWELQRIFLYVSLGLLLCHFAVSCHLVFQLADSTNNKLSDVFIKIARRLVNNMRQIGFINNSYRVKCASLTFLLIFVVLSTREKNPKVGYDWAFIYILVGLCLFLGDTFFLEPIDNSETTNWLYIVITCVGWVFLLAGLTRLSRAIGNPFLPRYLRENIGGFEQERKLIQTERSLHFRAEYQYDGRLRKSYINIVNPRRGVLVMGSPGSGKSRFIVKPVIEQLIYKGIALFVYDFKFPDLTHHAYRQYLFYKKGYPSTTHFYCINFTDLSRSHRCNLIDPATLKYRNDARGVSKTLLQSMNKTWASREGEFFIESPVNLLAALIWFLKNFQGGSYCTLPHVCELSKTPYDELFTILNAEPHTRGTITSFIQAYLNKTTEMLDGQVASAQIPLQQLDSADFYYVLSGNDLSLNINDPKAPAILCLGGDPPRREALAPVMSLYIDRLNQQINCKGGYPCAQVLDEFATVRATSVLNTITTARSNDVITLVSVQDITQLRTHYTEAEADQYMNTPGNLICGQVAGETARWVSERFHSIVQYKTTVSVNSRDTSVSKAEQSVDSISPAIIGDLSSGEFVGVVSDDPEQKLKLKGFHASIILEPSEEEPPAVELPIVREVTDQMLEENYRRIQNEVTQLVKSEMKRILADPALKQFIVKR